ncbi:unnamed protein product, partial [Ectocarpus sp. 12 AP-2014]
KRSPCLCSVACYAYLDGKHVPAQERTGTHSGLSFPRFVLAPLLGWSCERTATGEACFRVDEPLANFREASFKVRRRLFLCSDTTRNDTNRRFDATHSLISCRS